MVQHPKISDDVLKISELDVSVPFKISSLSSIRMCFANKKSLLEKNITFKTRKLKEVASLKW